jgi:hypothetical protein
MGSSGLGRVRIYDVLGNRGHLLEHARGGTERPFKSRMFAIPSQDAKVRRTARGISQRDTPSAIIANTPKRALRVTPGGIFVGKAGRLHLIYSFKAQVTQPKDVPFYEEFAYVMNNDMRTGFDEKMAKAMATRKGG